MPNNPTSTVQQFLNSAGEVVTPSPLLTAFDTLISLYSAMVETRLFDQKAIALQRTGQMGTYAPCTGAEAFSVGCGFALTDEDVLVPYYRDQGAQLLRGVSMKEILQYWGGDERGNDFKATTCRHDLPNCVPIATQLSHAAGIATALKIQHSPGAVLTTCGDGATSRGDFYEALNLAGVWQLPMVTVINNNQWAISVPSSMQTGAETLAQKAVAAGIEWYRIDGNDIVAVSHYVSQALTKARLGKGPTLIEAVSYRLSDHTTADDATRYRSNDELNRAWNNEPLKRLQHYLYEQQQWDEAQEQQLIEHCKQRIQAAVDDYLATPPQAATAMFDYLYKQLPASYQTAYQQLATRNAGDAYE